MLKKKNIYVIFISVLIIFLVILSSFLGLITYLQWRQLNLAYNYYDTLEELDTIAYAKNIEVNSLKIWVEFKRLGFVGGQIKNRGKKTVASIALKINFLDSLDAPVYNCVIYPLAPFQTPKILKRMHLPQFLFLGGALLKPNGTISFKWPLWQCPRKFVKMVSKGSFSNKPGEWCGRISAELIRVRLSPR